ncbi:MAG: hypothetical protein GY737_25755 [Desulfobacteraceae bacterium]|nr:hypothetical protein [Desulfobacteraceae bacterium]
MLSRIKKLQLIKKTPLYSYGATLKDVALKAFFLLLFLAAGIFTILFLAKMFWTNYQLTPVGQRYLQYYGERSAMISDFLSQDIFHLSLGLTWVSFSSCFIACGVLRLFHITSYLYEPRGRIVKILVFGLPLAALAGWSLYRNELVISFKQGYLLALLPTMLIFSSCFEYTTLLIPEIGEILASLKTGVLALKKKLDPPVKKPPPGMDKDA